MPTLLPIMFMEEAPHTHICHPFNGNTKSIEGSWHPRAIPRFTFDGVYSPVGTIRIATLQCYYVPSSRLGFMATLRMGNLKMSCLQQLYSALANLSLWFPLGKRSISSWVFYYYYYLPFESSGLICSRTYFVFLPLRKSRLQHFKQINLQCRVRAEVNGVFSPRSSQVDQNTCCLGSQLWRSKRTNAECV